MKMLRYLFKVSWFSYTAATTMVLFSIVVAVFCTNVVLGYAETYYKSGAGSTSYTVITIAGMDTETEKNDMMSELKKYKPSAALYICRTVDGAVLVGFDGTDTASNWWPDTGGTFINTYKGEDYPFIIYLRSYEMTVKSLSIGDSFDLDGKSYYLCGYGDMLPFNFSRLISKESPQTVFDRSIPDYAEDDPAGWFRIVPYSAFRESYRPDLIMLHFPQMNYGQILKMTDHLEKMFPGSTITPPVKSSDELYQYALQIMRRFIPLFLILTEITLVLALYEFYKCLRTECFICRICGMSRRKLRRCLIGVTVLLYLLGTGIAIGLHIVLKGVLTRLNAGYMPPASATALGVIVIFTISVLSSLPALNTGLNLLRSEE